MNWGSIVIEGLATGILLTLSFGAGFFALVQTSIIHGYKKGLFIALGAVISDLFFIAIAVFATSFISSELPKYAQLIRTVALVAFMGLGIRTILKSSKVLQDNTISGRSNYYYISKGFILNFVNPMVLLTWIGITVYLQSTLHYDTLELIVFFASVMAGTFGSQFGVCAFSHKIKKYLSDLFLHRMNIVIGIIFIVVGLLLFFNTGNDSAKEIEKAREFLK